MDWLNKIPQWIKIPIKVLLPSLALFSGFIVLASDKVLEYLNLLEFEKANGFAFSIIFLVSTCLIICYILWFVIEKLVETYKIYRIKSNQFKQFMQLEDVYRNALIEMYRSPKKSLPMELSNSITTYLLAIKAIGTSQLSTVGYIFDFYLQPWVIRCIEKCIAILRKTIPKYESRILKCKDNDEKSKLKGDLEIFKSNLEYLTTPTVDEEDDSYSPW